MSIPPYFAADTYDEASEQAGARVRRAADLDPGGPTQWLASGIIPRAAVTVLVGEEGIGKSLWWVLVVAHVTTGLPSPLLGIPKREPAPVVLILTEDTWGDVLARLTLAGADLSHVYVISEDVDGTGSPIFPRDFVLIDDELATVRPALIVLDAWLDTVSGGLQVKDTQQARGALHPWRERAARTGASVLLIGHTNRADTGDLRALVGATSALRQKARVLLFAVAVPDTDGVLYVGPDKTNHSARGTAIDYRIEVEQVRPRTDDDPGTVPRLSAAGDTGVTVRDHVARWRKEAIEAAKPPTAAQKAETWIKEYIENAGGQVDATTAKEAAEKDGVNPRLLAAAVKGLGGFAGPSGSGAPHVYRLPNPETFQTSQTFSLPSNGGEQESLIGESETPETREAS